jgi:Tfp pilus assembly protein PilN
MIRVTCYRTARFARTQAAEKILPNVGGCRLACATVWFTNHNYLSARLEQQAGRNTYLEAEIVSLDKQIAEIKR